MTLRAPASRPAFNRGRVATHVVTRAGFTLLELLLVVGLMAALAIMAWPMLENRITSSELPESASKLQSLLFMTRSQAITDHKRYRVRFDEGLQQPLVEVEPDAINAAGEWFETTEPWALENTLLGDVRVHAVKLGRPVYLTPQQTRDDAEAESDEGLTGVLTRAQEEVAQLVQGKKGLGEGETWPAIIFDVDGGTDWATVIIAKIDPDEELDPEDDQRWVVLDGRTGLAQITEQVTEEQLADAGFYVDREKLGMPETGENGEIIFTTPGQQFSPGGGTTVMTGGAAGGDAGTATAFGGVDLSGAAGAASAAMSAASSMGKGDAATQLPGNLPGASDDGNRPRRRGGQRPDGGKSDDGSTPGDVAKPDEDEPRDPTRPGANRRPGGNDAPRGRGNTKG